jgi:hypothetical protein
LWIFAPSVTQKSRLSGLLWQFAGKKIALQTIFRDFMREAQQTASALTKGATTLFRSQSAHFGAKSPFIPPIFAIPRWRLNSYVPV